METRYPKSVLGSDAVAPPNKATLRDYLALARLNHSTKHVFILPGLILACILRGVRDDAFGRRIVLGLITAVCIACANYVINEYLDRDFDRYHPTKSLRRAVQCEMSGALVLLGWLIFLVIGLSAALVASRTLFFVGCLFALQGVVYNVPPLRTKDKAYLDVISESINNPIRLLIGWAMVDSTTLPPSSIILSYWFGGAFLMAAKRYSEYREIVGTYGRDLLVSYRASFARYSETSLNASCFVYGLLSTFFLAIFLIKYRVEYLLLIPAVIALFGHYLVMATRENSTAQNPERLFRERGLIVLICVFVGLFAVATWVDIPALSAFSGQRYIALE